MTTDQVLTAERSPTRAERRRLLRRALTRSLAGAALLIALYYLAPLEDLRGVPVWLSLSVGLLILTVVILLQVRGITQSRYPGLRAVEALAVTAPLFLVLFAASYVVLAQTDAANFSPPQLNRTGALYFTMTIFATVGFGDITARSQIARVLVMTQMTLDFVIVGLVVQVYREAVNVGRRSSASVSPAVGPRKAPRDTGPSQGSQP